MTQQPLSLSSWKKPRRVCARRRNQIKIIFSGDMCVGEYTAQPANVRALRVRCSGLYRF